MTIKYTHEQLLEIASSMLFKYRKEISYSKDKELKLDIFKCNTLKTSYQVYIGDKSIMFVAYRIDPNEQVYSIGYTTDMSNDELNKAFEDYENFIRKDIVNG